MGDVLSQVEDDGTDLFPGEIHAAGVAPVADVGALLVEDRRGFDFRQIGWRARGVVSQFGTDGRQDLAGVFGCGLHCVPPLLTPGVARGTRLGDEMGMDISPPPWCFPPKARRMGRLETGCVKKSASR